MMEDAVCCGFIRALAGRRMFYPAANIEEAPPLKFDSEQLGPWPPSINSYDQPKLKLALIAMKDHSDTVHNWVKECDEAFSKSHITVTGLKICYRSLKDALITMRIAVTGLEKRHIKSAGCK